MKPKPTFSSGQDEILIQYVRENGALYDVRHKRYSDGPYKSMSWKKCGEKLKKDAEQCKRRWKSIRGQYRKIMKSKKTGADKKSKWKYEDQLQFLRPHLKEKPRLTLTNNESLTIIKDEEEEESLSQDADTISNPENLDMSEDNSCQQTANGTVVNYLLEEKRESNDQKDELDYFFESIKGTVKKFSPADKHLAKRKIFMIISDIERKYIAHSTCFHNDVPHNSQFPQSEDERLIYSP